MNHNAGNRVAAPIRRPIIIGITLALVAVVLVAIGFRAGGSSHRHTATCDGDSYRDTAPHADACSDSNRSNHCRTSGSR